MNKNYYIKEIRDLSKNYDSDTQSKILDDLTDKFFDIKGIMGKTLGYGKHGFSIAILNPNINKDIYFKDDKLNHHL